jgi:asparagine synthase (glutamine-hydrolysing)
VCGFAGSCGREPVDEAVLRRMTAAIAHRGPDGEGYHADRGFGLGARRLAIIDLSRAGAQPMASEDGDVVVAHNGELYDFRERRAELEAAGHRFRSRTDTEVVVHAYEEWGEGCVERLRGMFAFAVWDARLRRLLLARDRLVIKPLYWTERDGTLLFASEIKALLEHPSVRAEVSYEALDEYFTFQNVLGDRTLFEGVRILPPGCVLVFDADEGRPRIRRYWDAAPGDPLDLTDDEAAELVRATVERAVERQLVSDVPVGSYLSGGLDSGLLACVAARRLPRMSTFTAGFDLTSVSGLELGFDERRSAEQLATLLGTEHYEIVLHAGDMEWALPSLTWQLEDLRVGQSYPNYYVARLASAFVKVVLSGTGGDELFGGYPWRYRHAVGSRDREDFLRRSYAFWQRLVPDDEKPRLFNDSARAKIGDRSSYESFRAVYEGWAGPWASDDDFVAASLYFELKTFLHGLLVVEDRVSMAHSLETRVPLLDEELVELALRLPVRHKVADLAAVGPHDENVAGQRHLFERDSARGKLVLREAVRQTIGPDVADRIKQGFSAPDASWFRGQSIDFVNRLLRDPGARVYEFLSRTYVGQVLDEHTSGRVNHRLLIWSLLSFEWWCRAFLDGEGPNEPLVAAAERARDA